MISLLITCSLSILAYLLGALSVAILTCRAYGHPDPRTKGSFNPGATNVLRIAGKKAATITLLGDFLKGALPVLIGRHLALEPTTLSYIGLASVLGHVYPIYYRFQGGKGVATAYGAVMAVNLTFGLTLASIWVVITTLFRTSSLSAIISWLSAPVISYFFFKTLFLPIVLMSTLVLSRHRSNIRNLTKKPDTNQKARH